VERLVVSGRRFVACPELPASEPGQLRYRFVGLSISGADNEIQTAAPLGPSETASLDDNLGPAVAYSVSGADRLVSSVLVWSWEIVGALVVIAVAIWLIVVSRRRRREMSDYLF
jgi:hypothetical protein